MLDNWRRRLSQLPGQFVLNQEERAPFPDWESRSVGAYRLHTGPRTTVRRFANKNREVLVIGVIAAADDEAIDEESCPAGQYVAITHSEVFSDAGSLKQAFFDRATKSVASSPRLLAPPRGEGCVSGVASWLPARLVLGSADELPERGFPAAFAVA